MLEPSDVWLTKNVEEVVPSPFLGKVVGNTLGDWKEPVRYLERAKLSEGLLAKL